MERKSKSTSDNKSQGKARTMADIGRMGGEAPHVCRGFQCQKEHESNEGRSKSRSHSSEE